MYPLIHVASQITFSEFLSRSSFHEQNPVICERTMVDDIFIMSYNGPISTNDITKTRPNTNRDVIKKHDVTDKR